MVDTQNRTNHYHSQFALLEKGLNGESRSPLHHLRRSAFEKFRAMPWPTTRFEEWKYTNVEPLLRQPFEVYHPVASPRPEAHFWKDSAAYRMVFVNGKWSPELSDVAGLPSGLTMTGLAVMGQKDPDAVRALAERLPVSNDNIFAQMNTAFLSDGLFLNVASNAAIDRPVHCLFLAVPDHRPLLVQPRNIIRVEPGARVDVTEEYVTLDGGVHLTNTVTQWVVGPGAVVHYQKIQDEHTDAGHLALVVAQLERNSRLTATTVTLGARLTRNVVHVVMEDEGVEATLNGLYLTTGAQHADHRTFIDHAKPHCASHELYKGILDGRSTGVFNGKILVRPDAQKTDAKQSNHSLLLSEQANVKTKPQLEIFADDVKCTHGATIGRLDEEAMFYLRSRGLTREAARNILTYAFASEIVDRIGIAAVREKLDDRLKKRLEH